MSSAQGGAPPEALHPRLNAGQPFGPYRIGRLLGRGGMGEVYEAEHLESGRRVALKVLRRRFQNAGDRTRFLHEGQLAAAVSHPHTVYIFGSEEISGIPAISMELLPGGTLKDRVTAHGPLSPGEAVAAILDIIGGLDAAAAAGILHRDVKPSNCFLDRNGLVKVGDFGLSISTLARDVDHALETAGFQGTPQFAAPEQLRGEPLDVRADIYAVGATLYYLLTGEPPFEARDLRDLVTRVTTDPPASPRARLPEIPPALAAAVLRCLAKSPADRPPSYAALGEALRPFAEHENAPARPALRLLAGLLDNFIMTSIGAVWLVLTIDSVTPPDATTAMGFGWLSGFAYFFLLEGFRGASFGKRLFGLRVQSADGSDASLSWIAVRTAIFFMPQAVVGALSLYAGVLPAASVLWLLLIAALFSTARRRNGWAMLHDLASGTRVISRPAPSQHSRMAPAMTTAPRRTVSASPEIHCGPFVIVSDIWDDGKQRLLAGFDPMLRRQVWIHLTPPGTPAIRPERRDAGRSTRLFWLTGRRSATENWDAYEAPDGGPFLARRAATEWLDWPVLKLWLMELANELAAAKQDGSMPELGLDRIWIRNDGRLVLLDFPAPETAPAAPDAAAPAQPEITPVRLLAAMAAHELSRISNPASGPLALPLSVRALLARCSGPTPPELDEARNALLAAAAAPDRVQSWRRAVPIVLASVPFLMVILFAILAVPAFQFIAQNSEMLGLLEELHDPQPPATSRVRDPEIREAIERYLAGRYRETLASEAFWNNWMMQGRQDRQRTAAEVLARHPSVSPEEAAALSAIIASQTGSARVGPSAPGTAIGAVVLGVAGAAGAMLIVLVLSGISSVIAPGGIVTRSLGLAVVTRQGTEISRARSLARVLLAWLPGILWLAWLGVSPIQGSSPLLGASLAFGALAIGAIWTIARPHRGLHDRLVGTWVVPR